MKVITVSPISKGFLKENLSYWSALDIPVGSVISVPLRNKEIPALVLSIKDASDLKAELKSIPFSLKKITETKYSTFFRKEFLTACEKASLYYVATPGEIIKAFTPKAILDDHKELGKKSKQKEPQKSTGEKFAFQTDDEDRIVTYKSLIREEFAKKSSVFICFPTIQDIENVYKNFEKGIKEYTFVLHGNLPKKELAKRWKTIIEEEHPVLILATSSFICLPRNDVSTIIVEKESSRAYKGLEKPYADARKFVEIYAEEIGAKLILGDICLRTETIWRFQKKELLEYTSVKFHSLSTCESEIVDARSPEDNAGQKKFAILSQELKNLIKETRDDNGQLFILSGRRGLSPITVCGDCGTTIKCKNCSAPLVLHKYGDKNVFACHKCGAKRILDKNQHELCKNCGGWRLNSLGSGIDSIEEEITKEFAGIKVLRIDSDTTKTASKAIKTIDDFYNSHGCVLIGTEMAIPFLHKKIQSSAVVSMDSLFTVPDFRMNEKMFSMMISLRSKTMKKFLIQTRETDRKIFENVSRGDIINFYRDEIAEREVYGYPPYKTLIKIMRYGERDRVEQDMKKLEGYLSDFEPSIYPAFIEEVKSNYRMNALLQINPNDWTNTDLLNKLKNLPPTFLIKVDPEDIL